MKLKIFFVIICSFFQLKAQSIDSLRIAMLQKYEKGDIEEAYQIIKNTDDSNNTTNNLWLYKIHLKSIIDHKFTFNKILNKNLGLERRTFNESVFRSTGIYNTKEQKFLVPPIYQSLQPMKTTLDYLIAVRLGKYGIINLKNDTIFPFQFNQISGFSENYIIVTDDNYRQNLYDYNFKPVLNDYFEFSELSNFSNFFVAKKNKKNVELIDAKTLAIIEKGESIEATTLSNFSPGILEIYYRRKKFRDSNITLLKVKKEKETVLYSLSDSDGLKLIDRFDQVSFEDSNINKIINGFESAKHPEREFRESKHYLIATKNKKYGIYSIEDRKYYVNPKFKSIDINGNGLKNGKKSNIVFPFPVVPFNYGSKGIRYNVLQFENRNKFGVLNYKGEIILPAEFQEIISGERDFNILFFRKNYKWGFANLDKGLIQQPQYDLIDMADSSDNERWTYKNQKHFLKDYSLKDSMKVLYSKNLFSIDQRKNYFESQEEANIESKTESETSKPEPTGIFLDAKSSWDYEYDDSKGKIIKKEPRYSAHYYRSVNNGKKYGLKIFTNYDGKIIEYGTMSPLIYDSPFKYLGNNLFAVSYEGKYGIVDDQLRCILPFQYDEIDARYVYDINNIYLKLKKDGKYGLLNNNLNFLLPFEFDEIRLSYHQMYGATKSGKNYFFLSQKSNEPGNFNMFEHEERKYTLFQYHQKSEIITFKYLQNGKTGLVDYEEQDVIKPIYEDAWKITKYKNENYLVIKKNGNYYLANQYGKILVNVPLHYNVWDPNDINLFSSASVWKNSMVLEKSKKVKGLFNLDNQKLALPFQYQHITPVYSDFYDEKYIEVTTANPNDYYGNLNSLIDFTKRKTILKDSKTSIYSANGSYFIFNDKVVTPDNVVVSQEDDNPGIRTRINPPRYNVISID